MFLIKFISIMKKINVLGIDIYRYCIKHVQYYFIVSPLPQFNRRFLHVHRLVRGQSSDVCPSWQWMHAYPCATTVGQRA